MSFLKRQSEIKKKRALSLQKHLQKRHTHTFRTVSPEAGSEDPQTRRNFFSKRVSFGNFFLAHSEGSMTLEAALALPIFLFAIISILSFTEVLRAQMEINSTLQQTAKELSVYGHAAQDIMKGEKNTAFPAGIAFSETYVRGQVSNRLSGEFKRNSLISGLTFVGSKIMENDRIELQCIYSIKPYFALSPKAGFMAESTAVARAFTGYDNLHNESLAKSEEYVYITETGHAYHKSRDCHYLDLSIRETGSSDIDSLRNQSGGKYYACPLCAGEGMGGVTYITDYGDRYHCDLLCSSLKRTVKAVLLSEVGGRTPCSKCCH